VATMLEKFGFQQLIEGTLPVKRVTRAMGMYQFVLAMVLAVYVGFSRLDHLRFDTDTTVHTLFGHQMGGRKSYNPKNRGKRSHQPILTFLSETREYISDELRNEDWPTGTQITRHLESVFAALPPSEDADSSELLQPQEVLIEAYDIVGARHLSTVLRQKQIRQEVVLNQSLSERD
jgi:hypothetical protein